MGEYGRRSGTDFERSISGMLACLGYRIVLENESIRCDKQKHAKKTHGIDFLAMPPDSGLCKPVNAPNGLTLFSCKHAPVGDTDLSDILGTAECLRLSDKYKDLGGAVLVTAGWVQPDSYGKVEETEGLYLWDQTRCHLYGNLARNYMRLNIADRSSADRIFPIGNLETMVTRGFVERGVGCYGLFNHYEIGIFYEGTQRFNLDLLRDILQELRKEHIIGNLHLDRLIIHTTRGFTADFPLKLGDILKTNAGRLIGIRCSLSDLYDHSNAWFPSYIGRGIL